MAGNRRERAPAGLPISQVRPGSTHSNGRGRQPAAPAPEYPPGWFTEPCRAWWPGWRSSLDDAARKFDVTAHGAAQGRLMREMGLGFGRKNGTIALPNTPKWQAPGAMGAPA